MSNLRGVDSGRLSASSVIFILEPLDRNFTAKYVTQKISAVKFDFILWHVGLLGLVVTDVVSYK